MFVHKYKRFCEGPSIKSNTGSLVHTEDCQKPRSVDTFRHYIPALSSLENINSSFKMFTYLFYPLVHILLFSSRNPAARAMACLSGAPQEQQRSRGMALPGLQASVATGYEAHRPSDFLREVHKTFFKCKTSCYFNVDNKFTF